MFRPNLISSAFSFISTGPRAPTRHELETRYPGVHFSGEPAPDMMLASTVEIEAGARIALGGSLTIRGFSVIASTAKISGNCHIDESFVYGEISGGEIHQSIIEEGGCVRGGKVVNSTVFEGATVLAGLMLHNEFEDTNETRSPPRVPNNTPNSLYRSASSSPTGPDLHAYFAAQRPRSLSSGTSASAATAHVPPPLAIADEETYDAPVPEHFTCPISGVLMQDPVMTMLGHSYNRAEIEKWFRTSNKCPKTGQEIATTLLSNFSLRDAIEAWRSEHKIAEK